MTEKKLQRTLTHAVFLTIGGAALASAKADPMDDYLMEAHVR